MKKSIQFGAGNIGRGFIGALLSKSNYEVIFADVNDEILDQINLQKKYKIFVKDVESFDEEITNIKGVNVNSNQLLEEIKVARIITTAVGPLVLPKVALNIAEGIKLRKKNNVKDFLNIIACENMVLATDFLKDEIIKNLTTDEIEYLNEYVGFPNSSVDRIVPPIKNDNIIDVTVEKFYEWNVEKSKFKGEIPKIEGMNLVDNLGAYVERKLFTLNTGHAITAYLGYLKNYKTIDESIKDENIKNIVQGAMKEGGAGLAKKYNLDLDSHFKYIEKIIKRFENHYLKDDVIRVGREPIRKLGPKDRLVSPLLTSKGYNLPVDNLLIGISAALNYENNEDKQSVEIQDYIKNIGLKETIKKISNITDPELLNKIEENYSNIRNLI